MSLSPSPLQASLRLLPSPSRYHFIGLLVPLQMPNDKQSKPSEPLPCCPHRAAESKQTGYELKHSHSPPPPAHHIGFRHLDTHKLCNDKYRVTFYLWFESVKRWRVGLHQLLLPHYFYLSSLHFIKFLHLILLEILLAIYWLWFENTKQATNIQRSSC